MAVLFIAYVFTVNGDLYGRLIQTIPNANWAAEGKPNVTLILHKLKLEESTVEASLAVNYDLSSMLKEQESDLVDFTVGFSDGYGYSPTGLIFLDNFLDSANRESFGHIYPGFESEKFNIPVAPSVNGFPFDAIIVDPRIYLKVNGNYTSFNTIIQDRIPGRTLDVSPEGRGFVRLVRTGTEQIIVVFCSFFVLFITCFLGIELFKSTNGLNPMEGFISVFGTLLSIIGFREILGVSRVNGGGTLEVLVILIPLIIVFSGFVISILRGLKNREI